MLAGFGYVKEAITPMTEAVALESDDFSLRLALAGYLPARTISTTPKRNWPPPTKLAESDEEQNAVLKARVKNDQAARSTGNAGRRTTQGTGKRQKRQS